MTCAEEIDIVEYNVVSEYERETATMKRSTHGTCSALAFPPFCQKKKTILAHYIVRDECNGQFNHFCTSFRWCQNHLQIRKSYGILLLNWSMFFSHILSRAQKKNWCPLYIRNEIAKACVSDGQCYLVRFECSWKLPKHVKQMTRCVFILASIFFHYFIFCFVDTLKTVGFHAYCVFAY